MSEDRARLLWRLRWALYFRMLDRIYHVTSDPEWAKSEREWAAYKGVRCILR